MAVTVSVNDAFTEAETAETQDITGSSETPTFALCFSTRSDTEGSVAGNLAFSAGATDGTNEYSVGTSTKRVSLAQRSVAITDLCYAAIMDTVFSTPNGGPMYAFHDSFLSNGHRIEMNDGVLASGDDSRHLMEFAMSGGDLSVEFGVWESGDSTSISTTNKVDLLIVAGVGDDPEPLSSVSPTTALRYGFGVAANQEGGIQQACHAHAHNLTNSAAGRISDSLVYMLVGTDGAIDDSVSVSTFGATGFTISTAGVPRFVWWALNFNETKIPFVVPFSTPTSTGTDPFTGTNVAPEFLAISGTKLASLNSDTEGTDACVWSIGGYDGTSHFCLSAMAEEASSSVEAGGYADAVILALPNDDNTIDTGDFIEATVSSLDADGATLNYTAAASTARQQIAWGWGDAGLGPQQADDTLALTDAALHIRGRRQIAGDTLGLTDSAIAILAQGVFVDQKLSGGTAGAESASGGTGSSRSSGGQSAVTGGGGE